MSSKITKFTLVQAGETSPILFGKAPRWKLFGFNKYSPENLEIINELAKGRIYKNKVTGKQFTLYCYSAECLTSKKYPVSDQKDYKGDYIGHFITLVYDEEIIHLDEIQNSSLPHIIKNKSLRMTLNRLNHSQSMTPLNDKNSDLDILNGATLVENTKRTKHIELSKLGKGIFPHFAALLDKLRSDEASKAFWDLRNVLLVGITFLFIGVMTKFYIFPSKTRLLT